MLEDLEWLEKNWRPDVVPTEEMVEKNVESLSMCFHKTTLEEAEDPELNIFNASQRSLVRVNT